MLYDNGNSEHSVQFRGHRDNKFFEYNKSSGNYKQDLFDSILRSSGIDATDFSGVRCQMHDNQGHRRIEIGSEEKTGGKDASEEGEINRGRRVHSGKRSHHGLAVS